MYRILCFGDSNTWGFNPLNGLRFSENERWTGVLQNNLGEGFEIVEDGRNGRRILEKNDEFSSSIILNEPLDVVILFLGVNDLLFECDTAITDLIEGIKEMISRLKSAYRDTHGVQPEIILMAAVPVNEEQVKDLLYELEAEKIIRFGEGLRALADSEGCGFIDSGRIIRTSEEDGIHLDASEHRKLGVFVADYIRTFLISRNLQGRNY